MSANARCSLARCGLAYVSGNWWACACGAVGQASSRASAQESIDSHKEKGRENAWTVPRSHER